MLGAFVVLAMSAVAATSAFAVEEECLFEEGNLFAVCILNAENKLILQTSTVLGEASQELEEGHKFTIKFHTPATIECSAGTAEPELEPTATAPNLLLMKTTIKFTGCKNTSDEADCEVTSTEGAEKITTTSLDGTPSLAEEEEGGVKVKRLDVTFEPESGTTFATFSLKSKAGHTCLNAQSEGKVKGTELCYFLGTGQNIEEDEEDHLLQCVPAETLTFAGVNSTFEAEFLVELVSKKNWDIVEGI